MLIKKTVRKALIKAGIYISRASSYRPIDYSNIDIDPVSAAYRAGGRSFFIRVPLESCVHFGLMAFPCHPDSPSPFIKALREYADGECIQYQGSALERYYKYCQPESAADMLGFKVREHERLKRLPPSGAPFFWRSESPEKRASMRPGQLREDNREHGRRFDSAEGDPFFGPVSQRKGELEFQRLVSIYHSIKSHGHIIDYSGLNTLKVMCLLREGKHKFMIVQSGQHRIAALSALDYKEIVVHLVPSEGIGGFLRREEAEHWPLVRDSILTQEEAEKSFDQVFDGQQPPIGKIENWGSVL